jgi:hypothetical protein
MARRIGAIMGSAVFGAIVTLVGVIYFFEPIAATAAVAGPPVPAPVGLLIYIALSVLLLDWASEHAGGPIRASMMIAASQIILVSVDFVLRGERSATTGAASAVLILATWGTMGAVYRVLGSSSRSAENRSVQME